MINVYRYTDPSCAKESRIKIGEVKNKKDVKVFTEGYIKGLYDGVYSNIKKKKIKK